MVSPQALQFVSHLVLSLQDRPLRHGLCLVVWRWQLNSDSSDPPYPHDRVLLIHSTLSTASHDGPQHPNCNNGDDSRWMANRSRAHLRVRQPDVQEAAQQHRILGGDRTLSALGGKRRKHGHQHRQHLLCGGDDFSSCRAGCKPTRNTTGGAGSRPRAAPARGGSRRLG